MGRNKKLQQKQQQREMQENRGCRMNSAGAVNSAAGTKFRMLHFSSLFALLSFWDLICNNEFDSNSLCLDRLNNFGIISSQKLQNLPQNAISRIVGTLMCKSG